MRKLIIFVSIAIGVVAISLMRITPIGIGVIVPKVFAQSSYCRAGMFEVMSLKLRLSSGDIVATGCYDGYTGNLLVSGIMYIAPPSTGWTLTQKINSGIALMPSTGGIVDTSLVPSGTYTASSDVSCYINGLTIKQGAYTLALGTNRIQLTSDGCRFIGTSGLGLESTGTSSKLTYTGVAGAITVTSATLIVGTDISAVTIECSGACQAGAAATGIDLVNCRQCSVGRFGRVNLKSFHAGSGIRVRALGAGNFSGANTIIDTYAWDSKVGFSIEGVDAFVKDNHTVIFHSTANRGAIAKAGTRGFGIGQFADTTSLIDTDAEGFELGYAVGGTNSVLIAPRSEDCDTHIYYTANSSRAQTIGHTPEGAGTFFTDDSTAGNKGSYLTAILKDAPEMTIRPLVVQPYATTFGAGLPADPNGTIRYCSTCTIANPCAGAGTGAIAKRLNGIWVCN